MQRAFSLVELSIVLVILGLLTGGILAGQSLIRASELRSVNTGFQRYVTAAHSFRDKYFALPGDMTNAQSFWGVAHATPATCLTTAGTGTQTCNGDGNGQIGWALAGGENYLYWEHLANAGLVEGSYNGIASAGAEVAGTNIPRARMSNAGYVSFYVGSGVYNMRGNTLMIAKANASGAYDLGLIKPEEAWNIDTKVDDGKADSGKLAGGDGNGETGCITGTSWTVGAVYNLTSTSSTCKLIYQY